MLDGQAVETTLYSLSDAAPRPPDRRSSDRYVSLLRVGALLIGDRRELCLIRNISAGGMMIRAYSPVEPGTPVRVELKHGEAIAGIAQWVEGGLTGVAFNEPIDVLALLATSAEGPRPRMPRIELDCSAWLRADADVCRARAVNISQGGMCLHCKVEIPLGAQVIVSLPDLQPLAGVLKWRSGEACGIGFNRVLAVGELMEFLQKQKHRQGRSAAG